MPAKREIPNALDLIRQYQSGVAMRQILKQFGISDCLFYRLLRDHGIARRSMAESVVVRRNRPVPLRQWSPENPQQTIDRYLSGDSAKQLGAEFGVSAGAVKRFLSRSGITPRGRGDAELTKWKKIKRTPGGVERQCKKAWETASHSDDALEQAILDAYQNLHESCYTLAEKFKTSPSNVIRILTKNGAYQRLERSANRKQRNAYECCSPYEIPVLNALIDRGLEPVHQYAFWTRNLDIAFPELRIGLEIERRYLNDSKSMTRERVENLFNNGWRILIINDPNNRGISPALVAEQVIAFIQFARLHPSAPGQYGVIDGYGKPKARIGKNLNGWSRIPGF